MVTADRSFSDVMALCAQPRPSDPETWISDELIAVYTNLHASGFAHSIEAWEPAGDEPSTPQRLVGGLYGVSIGGAFFGESMFNRATDASKVCLVHLVNHLRTRGYALLDIQFTSPHMQRFGAVEVRRDRFLAMLDRAVDLPVSWGVFTPSPSPQPGPRQAARSAP